MEGFAQHHRLNPLVMNGLSHPYHLDESTFIFRGFRCDFSFLFHSTMKISGLLN